MATTKIISKAALAVELGLSRGRISQFITAGMPVRADGRLDRQAALAWVEENIDRRDRPLSREYAAARTADMVFRAKLRRLEFEDRRARLIEAEAVRRMAAEHVGTIRAGIEALPDKLAPALAAESDPRKVRLLFKTALVEELTRLSNLIAGESSPKGAIV